MNDIVYAGKHARTYNVSRHAHNSWELVYCTDGDGVFDFGESVMPYKAGDIVVIPPYTPHSNASDGGFTNIHINVTDATLSFKYPVLIKDDSNRFILNAFSAAFFHFYGDPERRHQLLSVHGELIARYILAYRNESPLSKVVEEIESNIITNYPDCNYELDTYLRSFPFSYDYLRKLFKKELGVTPHRYLSDKRLQTAADMLCSDYNESSSITEISRACGFREPLYFSRMFKQKYKVAPSGYQQLCAERSRELTEDPDSMKIMLDEDGQV